ncbi:hypothetical protein [Streptomyces sp. NPDC003688]
MAADMVVELQRADAKATAVCGAAAGLLTVGVAMLCGVNAPPTLEVVLLLTSLLLTAAVGAALRALRPALPAAGAPGELLGLRRGADAGLLVASFAEMSSARQQHLAEKRLSVMAVLARRKFRAVRLSGGRSGGGCPDDGWNWAIDHLRTMLRPSGCEGRHTWGDCVSAAYHGDR